MKGSPGLCFTMILMGDLALFAGWWIPAGTLILIGTLIAGWHLARRMAIPTRE